MRGLAARPLAILALLVVCPSPGAAGSSAGKPACSTDACHPGARGPVHGAKGKRRCTECHRPKPGTRLTPSHDGEDFHDTNSRCDGCHPAAKMRFDFLHGPLGVRACAPCHSPHAKGRHLLTARGARLCLNCHEPARFAGKVVHGALQRGCGVCHAPHGADNAYLVRKPCRDCHADGLLPQSRCLGCHAPHATDRPALLRRDRATGTACPRGN